jgi:hypothetical protein
MIGVLRGGVGLGSTLVNLAINEVIYMFDYHALTYQKEIF